MDWAEREGLVRREELLWWARWDLDSTLALMDRVGIATAVLNPTMQDRYRSAAQAREGLTVVFEAMSGLMAAHPGRFAVLAPAVLDHPEVTTWALRRAYDDLGAVGVSVKANYNGVYLGDPAYDRFLAELDDRAAVLFTHPLDLPGGPPGVPTVPGIPNFMCDFLLDTTRAAVNLIRTGTLDRHPHLSVVLPHAGGFLPQIATRMAAFGDFCTPPLDAARVRDHLHRFFYDTAGPLAPRALWWPPPVPTGSSSAPTGRPPRPTSSPATRCRPSRPTPPSPTTNAAASTATTHSVSCPR
ncbi:hypothetical protein SHKM778_25220 [Streptomyces sp. KM77-8]|uniref:Amidohydrolase-related domain-containing protein n=1 Tax=Streptomyces haneummycinicus TaxID=3074435 RepID=A0AAT9HFE2_9ACTN